MTMKTLSQCSVCDAIKPLSQFYKANHSYNERCKRCQHITVQLREGAKALKAVKRARSILFPDKAAGEVHFRAHIKVSELKSIIGEV